MHISDNILAINIILFWGLWSKNKFVATFKSWCDVKNLDLYSQQHCKNFDNLEGIIGAAQ